MPSRALPNQALTVKYSSEDGVWLPMRQGNSDGCTHKPLNLQHVFVQLDPAGDPQRSVGQCYNNIWRRLCDDSKLLPSPVSLGFAPSNFQQAASFLLSVYCSSPHYSTPQLPIKLLPSFNLSVTRYMPVCLSPPAGVCLCLRSFLFVFPLFFFLPVFLVSFTSCFLLSCLLLLLGCVFVCLVVVFFLLLL